MGCCGSSDSDSEWQLDIRFRRFIFVKRARTVAVSGRTALVGGTTFRRDVEVGLNTESAAVPTGAPNRVPVCGVTMGVPGTELRALPRPPEVLGRWVMVCDPMFSDAAELKSPRGYIADGREL
jgi:hypothetical protein